jgi:YD repeat-containing protein
LNAARRQTMQVVPGRSLPPSQRTVPHTRPAGTESAGRRALSLPSDPSATGTGINPWWRYHEENLSGGGHLMVNVGTGNVVLQEDDMSVPHKGIAMALRRTYNSQSGHDANASDATEFVYKPPGMYGNGWSNTFDAHMAKNASATVYTVFDVDGARYDYDASWTSYNTGTFMPRAGNHATLAYDGVCGWAWTKKSGTTYYFYAPGPGAACPQTGGVTGGFAGRLYQIVGRNRNTSLTLSYYWDGGNASTAGKISQINVQTESGMTTQLIFSDFNGHRLLSQVIFPDGSTSAFYGYDSQGNLTSTGLPSNNASGTLRGKWYGYGTIGTETVLQTVASPRWVQGCNGGCGSDGEWIALSYSGASRQTSTLSSIQHIGVINPVISDASGAGALQSGYSTAAYQYLTEYFTTGVTMPTYRDTDGHMTNWVADGAGRPTQTQECTASANQGQQCTGQWLLLNESWDASNNLVSEVDARGYQTDYAFDANGNAVAVAAPQTVTSEGTLRPTKLYDYDAFNNVVAYCDEHETHQAGADWTAAPAASDTLCTSRAAGVPHWQAAFTYPAYQPYGQLASMSTPLGYTRRFTYAASSQAGADYGLPTAVTGDAITQRDNSTVTPTQSFWYDGTGNLRCYSKGSGTYVLSYDALGRLTSEADPDDSSANAGSLCGKSSGQPGWNTQTTYTYFADGSKQTVQSPSERPYGVSSRYTYDFDEDVTTELTHHGCQPNQTCADNVTTKLYDGADRLVEVVLPGDLRDWSPVPWLTRYVYDLSQGSNVILSTASFRAYGNLYETREYVGFQTGSWTATKGNAFDALDRPTAKYAYSPSSNTTLRATTSIYDHDASTLGLLWRTIDPVQTFDPGGEVATFAYNERGATASVEFTGDGGGTPARTYTYDADGRQVTRSSSVYGTETVQYDADGRKSQVIEPNGGGITSPATITYGYYGDGSRASLGVSSAAVTANPLMTYDYRADRQRKSLTMTYAGITSPFGWIYTDGGRELSQTDPYTGTTVNAGTQGAYYPGSTLSARTSTYDASGQLSSLKLPGYPNYNTMTRDPEGSLLAATSIIGGDQYSGMASETMNFSYSTRGEAAAQYQNPSNPQWFWQAKLYHGLSIPTGGGTSGSFDLVNAALLQRGQSVLCNPTNKITRTGIDALTYDAGGRMTGRSITAYDGGCVQDHNETQSTAYDAENHTVGGTRAGGDFVNASMGWGPNGHPAVATVQYPAGTTPASSTTYYHYDGDMVLFTSDAQGRMVTLNAELLGAAGWNYAANPAQGSNSLTVSDRDYAAAQVSNHNGTGYGNWNYASGAHSSGGVLAQMGATTEPVTLYASNSYTAVSSMYVRSDGFEGPFGTVQGVRVSNDLGVWTTPDAYAGNVHDPMSQKPYMWNRNNPYEYSDSSGYYWEYIDPALRGTVAYMMHSPTFAARFQAIAKDKHPFRMQLFYPKKDPGELGHTTPDFVKSGNSVKFYGAVIYIVAGMAPYNTQGGVGHEVGGHAYGWITDPGREADDSEPYEEQPREKNAMEVQAAILYELDQYEHSGSKRVFRNAVFNELGDAASQMRKATAP